MKLSTLYVQNIDTDTYKRHLSRLQPNHSELALGQAAGGKYSDASIQLATAW